MKLGLFFLLRSNLAWRFGDGPVFPLRSTRAIPARRWSCAGEYPQIEGRRLRPGSLGPEIRFDGLRFKPVKYSWFRLVQSNRVGLVSGLIGWFVVTRLGHCLGPSEGLVGLILEISLSLLGGLRDDFTPSMG